MECKDGKLHINPVLECYNGEIIGLAMDDNMKATLRCNAIDNAYKETGAKKELLYIVMLVANIQVEYIEKHLVSILKFKA